ncbi:hypothetical protein F4604DRAFT_1924250 [Suillus subluteus]|nr:hypothetical protein F4604DRAFT_1924250 [Suillus subluteus]
MKKAKSTWVGPEGKTAKSTREQSSSSHPSQNDAFDEERMMVSPILGPAMPFHDALDEDLQIPEDRASTSSSFSMSMSEAEVDSSSHLAAGNMQGHAADKRSPAYFAQEAEVESSSQPGAGDMQQDAADKRSPAYSAQEAEGDVSRSIHHEYLKTLNLMINAELRLLCCEICQVAILPSTAKTHVKVEHSQREFDAVKFAEAVAEEGIPSDLPNLSGPRSRVKGLAVKDAIACGLCDKVLTNVKGMHNHHSEAHKGFAMPREWRACKAQRLRNGGPGTHQVLWEVDSYVETEDQTEQLIRGIMKDMESVLQVVEAPQDERKVSPWLLTTRWHEHLAGQQADDLMGLVAIPKEDDELMPQLKKHVYAYFEGALALLSTTDELTLQRLNSPDPMKNGISNTPFHRHQEKDTMQKYILPIVALLAMLMRSNPCAPFHFSKTRELQDMTEALSISLEYGQEEATVSSHIHELLIFIWTTKWKQNDQNLIADPTELCLALLTAQKDDEYCMRATFVKEIKDRVTKGVAADEEEACNALEPCTGPVLLHSTP